MNGPLNNLDELIEALEIPEETLIIFHRNPHRNRGHGRR